MTRIAPMYVCATEMVSSYYKRLGLRDKRVLTIAGSGDQIINALFYGAKEVVGFDINRNALFLTELKIAAIRTLSYPQFIRYFSQTKTGFSHALYATIRPALSKACKTYFDRLYTAVGSNGLGVSKYFRSRSNLVDKAKVLKINGYLADQVAYSKIRKILERSRPTLYVENLLTLATSKKFQGNKFDIINLSNVPNYLTGRSFGLNEEDVLAYFRKIKKLSSVGGIILFYSYDDSIYPHTTAPAIPPISRASFLKKIKQTRAFRVSQESFPGLIGKRDRVTLLGS